MNDFLRKLSILLRNIFTKKALIYIIIFLLILLIRSNVFAFEFTYNDVQYNLPDIPNDIYENYFIFRDGDIIKLVSLYPSTRVFYENYSIYCVYDQSAPSSERTYLYYTCNINGSTWSRGYLSTDSTGFYFSNFAPNNQGQSQGRRYIIYSNFDIYNSRTQNDIYFENSDAHNLPYIINSDLIPTWNFSTLNISGGTQFQATLPEKTDFTLFIYYANNYFSIDIKPFMQYTDIYNHIVFYVPKQKLLTNYNIIGDETLHFVLRTVYHDDHTTETITDNWELGTYTLNIDSSSVAEINNNSNRELFVNIDESINNQTEVINQQTQKIEETTQAVDNLNDTITDSNIESSAEDLPTTNVQDPTQNGIDNIFQSIYNAFCTGEAQDIVFPIPFTNKNITLSPYYVRDMLNNNGASWVYLLIQAFWGYLIGRYIVKDISHKITKIKSGDIENIENNNIKEEML